jgi:predicted RNA methylase
MAAPVLLLPSKSSKSQTSEVSNIDSSAKSLGRIEERIPSKNPPKLAVRRWEKVEDFPEGLAVLESVFWEPPDTEDIRRRIRDKRLVTGKRVFELGTGSGLVSLCCLKAEAIQVVATDVNRNSIECAAFNARRLGLEKNFELRWVEPGNPNAYVALKADEKFDFIVSNPPWEDGQPESIEDYAFYDYQFRLLDSILKDAVSHLTVEGEIYLAYGCKAAIRRIFDTAGNYGWTCEVLDNRKLEELSEVFLPGMTVRLYRRGSK